MNSYYYPTTLIVLDDDVDFLASFALRFSDEPLLKIFSDPHQAIRYLFDSQLNMLPLETFISPYDGDAEPNCYNGDRLIRLRSAQVPGLLQRPERFSQASVIVVDYDMAGFNGLQVCRAISNLPVRRLLLTGKAGVETGVRALNDGLIEGYFAKQDRDLARELRCGIARQRGAFFDILTSPFKAMLCADEMSFLTDASFEEILSGYSRSVRSVEHYVTYGPPGILFVADNGTASWVLVTDELGMKSHFEIAAEADAPHELKSLFAERRVIAFFPNLGGFYSSAYRASWRNYVTPARHFKGERDWYHGSVGDSQQLSGFMDQAVPLGRYLKGD